MRVLVAVRVLLGVWVSVAVRVAVRVLVLVRVLVALRVGVAVRVLLGVFVAVRVAVAVLLRVAVRVIVAVYVADGVRVCVAVAVTIAPPFNWSNASWTSTRGTVTEPPVRVSRILRPLAYKALNTSVTDASGLALRISAQTPATWGVAMDVPDKLAYELVA